MLGGGEGVDESEEQGAPSETLPEPVVAASEGPSPADPAPDSIGLDCLKQAKLVNQTSQYSFPDTHYWARRGLFRRRKLLGWEEEPQL
ncbi:hypothetical protein HPP92_006974 [Vanilla planifolia]|uniref:Uncharacterized protein n=1 Tax=Vanilla planifolia TaxID=51239 RepID=A0A835RJI2_VANPL|nr:hypothetical protein HPP92_006974 [Vanilla planifolia]